MATLEKQDSVIQIIQLRVDGADQKAAPPADPPLEVDIEHAIVQDDPRNWSKTRKVLFWVLFAHSVLIN